MQLGSSEHKGNKRKEKAALALELDQKGKLSSKAQDEIDKAATKYGEDGSVCS